MKLTQSYKQKPIINEHYDVICIGSGLGSLCTASILARKGMKVLVCEKHTTPGGFTHVFTRNDYEWDVGLHYVGDMDRKGSLLRVVFEHITDKNLKWADMGEVYDKVIIEDRVYEYHKGLQAWKSKMKDLSNYRKSYEKRKIIFQQKMMRLRLINMLNYYLLSINRPKIFTLRK